MNFYIPFALFFILLCYVYRNNTPKSSKIFVVTMVLSFIFAAIRYQFGPDWFSYYDTFNDLQAFGAKSYIDNAGHSEPAFILYFSMFPSYTLFLAVNSLFWFATYTIFFRNNVNEKYYWFVLIMLFFDVNCILNNLVAMRQAISAFLFVLGFMIFKRNNITTIGRLWFALILIICSAIHASCLILIPLVFLNSSNKSFFFSKWYAISIISITAITVFIGRNTLIAPLAEFLMDNIEDLQRYETYIASFKGKSMGFMVLLKYILSTVLCIIPLLFIIKKGSKETDTAQIIIYKLGIIIATIGCVFGQGILARFMMILNPFYIAALIRACTTNKNMRYNTFVLLCVIFSSVYSFYHYIQADFCVTFLTYQTVFSAPFIP